jgi:hypothetical protein
VIVGITGHQDLGDAAAVAWVHGTLIEQIARRRVHRGLSSLAAGADQIFAEVLQSARIELEAVIPCAGYEVTFGDDAARAGYERSLAVAASVHRLPFGSPSEQAFLAAGAWIVSHCDLLIAVWNGLPARGIGGTGDVVALAQAQGRAWLHLDPVERTVEASARTEQEAATQRDR